MSFYRTALILMTVLCSTQASYANNLSYLQDSVLSEFNEEDTQSFTNFANASLNSLADKERKNWLSDSKKLKGVIRPLATLQHNGLKCRETHFMLEGQKHSTAVFTFEMCKVGEMWEFRESPLAKFKDADWKLLSNALNYALDEKQEGDKHEVKSDAHSVHIMIDVFQEKPVGKQTCRDAEISVRDADDKKSSARYTFCKTDNEWARYAP